MQEKEEKILNEIIEEFELSCFIDGEIFVNIFSDYGDGDNAPVFYMPEDSYNDFVYQWTDNFCEIEEDDEEYYLEEHSSLIRDSYILSRIQDFYKK